MSYRELRDATEILRALDFPRLVSIENFRIPNFDLMSEILEWMVKKFDPNTRIPKNKDTESDRILFVKTCVLSLMQRARIRLNPRNLYMSDGHAVREMIPVLKLLRQTTRSIEAETSENSQLPVLRNKIMAKKQEIQTATQLATEIPVGGAAIYDLLGKELFAKEARIRALSQQLNVAEVEKHVRQLIEKAHREEQAIQNKLDSIGQDEQNLDTKIDRRRLECDQLQKRLAKAQSYRPHNQDEFERYESDLKRLYDEYVIKYRNLAYIKQQMNDVEVIEQEKRQEAEKFIRHAVETMRAEKMTMPPIDFKAEDDEDKLSKKKDVHVFGNMVGAGLSDDSDDDDNGDDDDDDDDDDDNEFLDIPSENGLDDLEITGSNSFRSRKLDEEIENFNPEAETTLPDEKTENSDEDF